MDGDSLTLDLATSIDTVPAAEWDAVAGRANPFVGDAVLAAVAPGRATRVACGWVPPQLVVLLGVDNVVVAPKLLGLLV